MEDAAIIRLFFARDEAAISETEAKYGAYCRRIALNVLPLPEDAEEVVSDAWHRAWEKIPPLVPASLRAFLGKLTRDAALSRWRAQRAQKRGGGMELLLSELEDCLPGGEDPQRAAEGAELTALIDAWLGGLAREDRVLFLRRYWYGEAVKELARQRGQRPQQVSQSLLRLRRSLKKHLEEGGYEV